MALTGDLTYVGFGFGAIQGGLFLYEAFRSGHFRRVAVAEVVPQVVAELRAAGGFYSLNIAHSDRIETVRVGPVEIYDPGVEADRGRIVEAVAEAHEIGTAVPSVNCYETGGRGSLHRVLAAGLALKTARAVVYAAENDNRAAETLEGLVRRETVSDITERPSQERVGQAFLPAARPTGMSAPPVEAVSKYARFLNTVIGKMSGFAADPARSRLPTVTPRSARAFLVESFNRILVSRPRFAEPFTRGLDVFVEKDDLLPFEEAKLFGHNATHALAAYLAMMLGIERMADLRGVPGFVPFLRGAFIEESGAALIRKHRGVDELFTPDGYRAYADDLLERMTNPFLMDTVERVGRDPVRKLGWDDRLVGTIRLAMSQGVEPRRYAIGAAAALAALDDRFLDGSISAGELTAPIWAAAAPQPGERDAILALIERGRRFLAAWRDAGLGKLNEESNR